MIDSTIRQLGLCGEQMANDMRRRSGRTCERKAYHKGKCASQFSEAGKRDRMIAFQARELTRSARAARASTARTRFLAKVDLIRGEVRPLIEPHRHDRCADA